MKIIDAHIHFCPGIESFRMLAEQAGHRYTEEHLQAEFSRLGIEYA